MPKYRFQCVCGIQFEARNSIAKHMEPKPCPECNEPAARLVPADLAGHFNQQADGPGPQNTGVQGFDVNVDRVIGQSAAQGKAFMQERSRQKREYIERNQLDPKRIGRLPDGTYAENSPEEQAFAIRANKINSRAMSTLAPGTRRQ